MLLWPPRKGVWLRVAIITLFLGGGMINPFRTDSMQVSDVQGSLPGPEVLSGYMPLIFSFFAALLIAGFLYICVSAVFQFVFVDCLSSGKILFTRTFRLRWGKGLHLIGFYLILLVIILISALLVILTVMMPVFVSETRDFLTILIRLMETLIILLIILMPVWIIAILTADFVVPVMIVDDTGIISGWKQVVTLFHGRWTDAGTYIALKIFLIFLAGVILGVITFLISIPLGIPDIALTIEQGSTPTPSGILLIGLGTGAMMVKSLLLLVPVITFFRYYSLAVLRDLSPRYSLLPPYPPHDTNPNRETN